MTSYEYRAPVEMSAQRLFQFLARPDSLPQHLPGLTDSTPSIDHDRRTLSWAENGYQGRLSVADADAGLSEVVITVETDDPGDVRRELEEAVAALSHRATAEADSSATKNQDDWY